MLREWGVPSVEVQEIIELDGLLTKAADEVCGLILLARWTAPEKTDQAAVLPKSLWFANQTSSYSCASVAIMNIINNQSDLDLGTKLNVFREETRALSPKDRGIALDSFDFVRNIHNSFSTEIDKLNVDQLLKDDMVKWERKVRAEQKADNVHRKKRRRVTMDRKRKKDNTEEDYSDNGFHFIAYAPCDESLWKMDGLEALPKKLDSSETENWLFTAASDLQCQMQMAAASGFEFSLLALVKRHGGMDDANEAANMQRTREDWGPFLSHMVKLHAERGDIRDMMK